MLSCLASSVAGFEVCGENNSGCCKDGKADCREGEGDCDKDSHCAEGFKCGSNNCAWGWGLIRDDCCTAKEDNFKGN